MKALFSLLAVVLTGSLLPGTAAAQDITGDWQGTRKGDTDLRLIMRVSRQLDGSLQARTLAPDQNPPDWGSGNLVTAISLDGSVFKFTIDAQKAVYEGQLSADGNSITGTITMGKPLPLNWSRVTRDNAWRDPAPHTDRFITVDTSVNLEVLDYGGSGSALVLLAGLGNTGHIFDRVAPKLVDQFHVYAITRRGHGASSMPASGYDADRLADDALKVIEVLKLNRPIVAGHSVAGEELSSIGTRHPEKVSGLIYLDAGYAYALYHPLCTTPKLPVPATERAKTVGAAVQIGTKQFTDIKPSTLLIFAAPKEGAEPANDNERGREGCVQAFQAAMPSARIVRLPGAAHHVFISNEADVVREIHEFGSRLRK